MPTSGLVKNSLTLCPVRFLGLGCFALLCSFSVRAQTPEATPPTDAAVTSQQATVPQTPGSISGRVIDQAGVYIGGAQVTLTLAGQSRKQEAETDANGRFTFAQVPAGPFHLTIASEGLAPQDMDGTVRPGEGYAIPDVMLLVATQHAEVQVALSQEEIAQEQVRDEEKQRVFGIIPNYYVTYDRHPVPLTWKQKFHLAYKSSVDPITFVGVGALAGADQAANRWKGYGQGAEGYAKRYGATYANVFIGTYIGGAILPSVLKQDPRYFYKGTGSKKSRFLYAIASQFIAKGDNGKWQPNYSNLGGDLAAGAFSNLYYPSSSHHGVQLVFSTALVRLGETTAAAIFQEFLVPKLTPNLPTRSPTQQ
jgi:hypothetical protein